jgi:hypothetical protein
LDEWPMTTSRACRVSSTACRRLARSAHTSCG